MFDVEILLRPIGGEKKIEFNKLSSGEKQMIYSVSSIIYHLINLNSVSNTKKRIAYKYVNIVLEEIELYFHPEMQRTYINYILESIKRIELKRIKGINFCFVTHSPFILSDIPDSNILFLTETGMPYQATVPIKTFAGNIHDLLAHSFFLSKGVMGEFAKNTVQNIIDNLNSDFKGEPRKLLSKKMIFEEIQIIGEPFLKEKLLEMYYDKFNKSRRIAALKLELKRLESND